MRNNGGGVSAALQSTGKLGANGRQMAVWQDFVAGTNPTDANDFLRAMIAISNGMPCVSWSPNLNTNGEVRVHGDGQDEPDGCGMGVPHKFRPQVLQ